MARADAREPGGERVGARRVGPGDRRGRRGRGVTEWAMRRAVASCERSANASWIIDSTNRCRIRPTAAASRPRPARARDSRPRDFASRPRRPVSPAARQDPRSSQRLATTAQCHWRQRALAACVVVAAAQPAPPDSGCVRAADRAAHAPTDAAAAAARRRGASRCRSSCARASVRGRPDLDAVGRGRRRVSARRRW